MDLSSYRVTGTDDPNKQVSVTAWNNLLTDLEDQASEVVFLADHGIVADGATVNSAATVETAAAALGTRGGVLCYPRGHCKFDRDPILDSRRITVIGYGDSNVSSVASASTLIEVPAGYNGISFLNTGGSAGAQRSFIRDIAFYQPTRLTTTAVADHTAGTATFTITSGTNDYASGQTVALEGAGSSETLVEITGSITNGTAAVTVSSLSGATNPGVYIGQHIDIAGAGLPAGTTVTAIGSNSITLSNNATATVSGAAITVKWALVSRVASVAGSTITLTQTPNGDQSVTGGVLKHRAAGVYASCTLAGDRVATTGFDIGLFLHGEGPSAAQADNGVFTNCPFKGVWADVACYGNDAQANLFQGCNFGNGSEINFLDHSIIGNLLVGCHFAFGVGIAAVRVSNLTKLSLCYFEGGTSYHSGSTQASASDCQGMRPVCGWGHKGPNDAASTVGNLPGVITRSLTVPDSGSIDQITLGGAIRFHSASYRVRIENRDLGVPFGATGMGIELFQDTNRTYSLSYNRTTNAYVGYRIVASGVEIAADSGNVTATFDNTGLNLVSGDAYYINSTKVVGAQGAAVADAAALTSVDGTTAAAAPTQAEFNALVAEFNKLRTDVGAVRTTLNTSLARDRAHGLIAT